MNINAISARARREIKFTGELVYKCGCREPYTASSSYGFGMVSGMSSQVECEACRKRITEWAERMGPLFAERDCAFDDAVNNRNALMAATGVASVYDDRITTAQALVLVALRLRDESWSARYYLHQEN